MNATKPRLEENKIVWFFFGVMNACIHYCYRKQGTLPKWWQNEKGIMFYRCLIMVTVFIQTTLQFLKAFLDVFLYDFNMSLVSLIYFWENPLNFLTFFISLEISSER